MSERVENLVQMLDTYVSDAFEYSNWKDLIEYFKLKYPEERPYLIYKHTNKITGKSYIGQTCMLPPNNRFKNGWGYIYNVTNPTTRFANAIIKYKWENFNTTYLQVTNASKVDEAERYWITYYNTLDDNYGYNLDSGGNALHEQSEETKLKKSIYTHLHHKISEDGRRRISEARKANTGWQHKESTKELMRKHNGRSATIRVTDLIENTVTLFDSYASLIKTYPTWPLGHITKVARSNGIYKKRYKLERLGRTNIDFKDSRKEENYE